MFAPLEAGLDIVVDNESALPAFHRDIVREDLDLFPAPGTLPDREGGRPDVCGTRAG